MWVTAIVLHLKVVQAGDGVRGREGREVGS